MKINTKQSRLIINILNILGIVGTVIFIIWAWRRNLFTDETVMKYYLGKFGPGAPLFFIIIQIIQTVVPIIPGALTIPLGIVVFGHVPGFFYNFTFWRDKSASAPKTQSIFKTNSIYKSHICS